MRGPWTVSLAIDREVFVAGQSVTLTATADQQVAWTNGAYRVFIKDVTTGSLVGTCTSGVSTAAGYTCEATSVFYSGDPHEYQAFVASASDPELDVQASSNVVSTARTGWSVSLAIDRAVFAAGQSVTLTATADQQVYWTNGAYRMYIKDLTTGALVGTCASGRSTASGYTCTATSTFYTGGPHEYQAFVAAAADHEVDVQASSNVVSAMRKPWTVSLAIDREVFAAGQSVTLTATADQQVYWTNGAYRMYIKDLTTGTVVGTCGSGVSSSAGYTCWATTTFYTGGPHEYQAFVAAAADHEVDVQASSNVVSAMRKPWTVSLAIDREVFAAGQSVTLTATADQQVYWTNGAYRMYIKDLTTGTVVGTCGSGVSSSAGYTCRATTTFYTGGPHEYQAFIAATTDHAADIQTSSSSVSARRKAWTVGLAASRSDVRGGEQITLVATANQQVGYTNGHYRLYIRDISTWQVIGSCSIASSSPAPYSCAVTITAPTDWGHFYSASVAASSGPTIDIQATSNGFSAPNADGPTRPGETAGGANPSEDCSQRCHGDPINSATGEFFETATDLALAGVGPSLALTRTYGSSFAATDGPFGYGWANGYAMRLEPNGGADLVSSPWIEVVQENGSTTRFTATGDGAYSAPFRTFATLERLADGTYRFVRRQNQIFVFDAAGRLSAVQDRNGNAVTLAYSGQRLASVTDDDGRSISLTWAGGKIVGATDDQGRSVTYEYSGAGDLVRVTLPDGAVRQYSYEGHRVVSMVHPDGGVTRNTYDAEGRVVSQVDPVGRTTTFAYATGQTTITDSAGSVTVERYVDGQVISETKGAGSPVEATTVFTYGATNQVTAVTDPLGRTTRFTYDARGNRTSVTDALGRTSMTVFDEWNSPTRTINAAGESTSLQYDERGNLQSMTAPDGAVTSLTVNPDGTVASSTDPTGRTTTYTYDAHGFLATATGPDGAQVVTSYDSLGNLLASTDPRGTAPGAAPADYTTTFSYDAAGRLLTSTDPLAAVVAQAYDAAGRPTTTTNPLGATSTTEYDLAGQLTKVTDALGNETTFTYDGAGRVLTVTDASGATATNEYDALGRLVAVTDPLGRTSRTEYDAGNRVTATVSPWGARTTYTYDAADQLLSVTNPLGMVTTTTYDAAGRPVTVTDADGRAVTTTYDAAGRPTKVTRADGSELSWTYDAAGRVLTSTDAGGGVTTYTYDAAGRRATATDVAGRVTSYTYGPSGLLDTVTLPGGGTVTYAYDAVGRRTGIDYSDATPDVTYVYDDAGRTVQMLDGTGTTTYSYDDLNRLTGTTHAGASVGYAWDDVSRLTALTYPSGDVVTRTYDDAGQLATVTDWADREFGFDWTDDGQLAQVSYPNGVVTSYDRDVAGQVTGLTAASQAGHDLLELAYGYSDAGLMTDRTTTRGTVAESAQFAWDPLARLDAVTGAGAGDVGFDAAGSVTVLPDGREFTYDAGRQLTALTLPAPDDTVVTTGFTYDARGNRLTATTDTGPDAGTVTHTYDLANRLTAITGADEAATTYTYDGNGLRATATTGDSTESFTWDLAAAYPLLLTDADHAYIYGTAGVPLAQIGLDGDAVDYLHTDALGSVLTTTDATGTVTAEADYDEYGLPQPAGAADAVAEVTSFGYAGEYTDPTGHLYLRARYYDPTTAQFLTLDALIDVTGNPYGYTGGNPLQFADPLGLDWLQDLGDWSAGFGDTITFGGTRWVREQLGVNDVVNTCSVFYEWGGYGGNVAQVGLAVATGGLSVAYDAIGTGVSAYDAWSAASRGDYAAAAWAAAGALPFVPRGSRGALDGATSTADDIARLSDNAVVVRGGTSDVPPAGEVFSGAHGQTLEEAGAYVPYGQLRATTAGEIRRGGGTVDVVPEMTRGGNLNPNHVNICLGPGSCPFGPLIQNPVPKPGRIQ